MPELTPEAVLEQMNQGNLHVNDLARHFGVVHSRLQQDMITLEREGKIARKEPAAHGRASTGWYVVVNAREWLTRKWVP